MTAQANDGLDVYDAFVKWVTEMRYGYDVASDWTPIEDEVSAFIDGFLSKDIENDDWDYIPSPDELYDALANED